jgi:hypothetical protein
MWGGQPRLGGAVQVDPMSSELKAPGTNLLTLKHDGLLSTNFNLRRYNSDANGGVMTGASVGPAPVIHCSPRNFMSLTQETNAHTCCTLLASSFDVIELKKRAFNRRWMTWEAISANSLLIGASSLRYRRRGESEQRRRRRRAIPSVTARAGCVLPRPPGARPAARRHRAGPGLRGRRTAGGWHRG